MNNKDDALCVSSIKTANESTKTTKVCMWKNLVFFVGGMLCERPFFFFSIDALCNKFQREDKDNINYVMSYTLIANFSIYMFYLYDSSPPQSSLNVFSFLLWAYNSWDLGVLNQNQLKFFFFTNAFDCLLPPTRICKNICSFKILM